MAQARGKVTIDTEECKGCGVCVDACPPKCLVLDAGLECLRRASGALYAAKLAPGAASASMRARNRERSPCIG